MIDPLAAVLRLHLVLAFSATGLFWVTAASPKGGPFHRAAGRWFARLVYLAAATGGVLAVARLAAPPDAGARQMSWLVLYFLVLAVAPVQHGLAAVAAGPSPRAVRSRRHLGLSLAAMAGSVLLLPAALMWGRWLFLVVVPYGFVVGLRQVHYAGRAAALPGEWRREHLTSLLTTGIVLHTALAVFAGPRLAGGPLEGWAAIAAWAGPLFAGLPLILRLRRADWSRAPGRVR